MTYESTVKTRFSLTLSLSLSRTQQDNEAGFGEFPWTVAIILIDNDQCICGGSLIHPKAILTGSHCVSK